MQRSVTYLRHHIIAPALAQVADMSGLTHICSDAAEDMVLGTAAVESEFTALHQIGGGPALGLWQIEPRTARDVWDNYLGFRPKLAGAVASLTHAGSRDQQLADNLKYAAVMCRLIYLRCPRPLPRQGNIHGYAVYWKAFYNTALGKGDPAKFVATWSRLIAPTLTSEV